MIDDDVMEEREKRSVVQNVETLLVDVEEEMMTGENGILMIDIDLVGKGAMKEIIEIKKDHQVLVK